VIQAASTGGSCASAEIRLQSDWGLEPGRKTGVRKASADQGAVRSVERSVFDQRSAREQQNIKRLLSGLRVTNHAPAVSVGQLVHVDAAGESGGLFSAVDVQFGQNRSAAPAVGPSGRRSAALSIADSASKRASAAMRPTSGPRP
jgi:hypothetical protein